MENLQPKKLSNVQLELLKLYERNISDKDLIELKDHIGLFFLDRYVKKADEAWEKNGWTEATMEEFLKTKMRRTSGQAEN